MWRGENFTLTKQPYRFDFGEVVEGSPNGNMYWCFGDGSSNMAEICHPNDDNCCLLYHPYTSVSVNGGMDYVDYPIATRTWTNTTPTPSN